METAWMTLGLLLSFLERRGMSTGELAFLRAVKELAEEGEGSFRVFRRPSGYLSAVIDLSTLVQVVLDFSGNSGENPVFSLFRKGFFGTSTDGVEIAPYSVWEAIFGEIKDEMEKKRVS